MFDFIFEENKWHSVKNQHFEKTLEEIIGDNDAV